MTLKQSVETLASLAKECKMATQREPSTSELHLRIQHTIYMRDVMKDEWQNDHTVHGSRTLLGHPSSFSGS